MATVEEARSEQIARNSILVVFDGFSHGFDMVLRRMSMWLLCFGALFGGALSAEKPVKDLTFSVVDGHELKLDLHFPEKAKSPPLVVYIHEGGWKDGSRKRFHAPWLTDYGFAVASISYRLTDRARFPAQIHDCKGALRWLRKNATIYG